MKQLVMEPRKQARGVSQTGGVIQTVLGLSMIARFCIQFPGRAIGFLMGREILRKVLAQEGCEGVCLVRAVNADGSETLVCVGVDLNGRVLHRMSVDDSGKVVKREGIYADRTKPPPPPPTADDWPVIEPIACLGEEISSAEGHAMVGAAKQFRGFIIGRVILERILAVEGCAGVTFYNAFNPLGFETLVYVGVSTNGTLLNGEDGKPGFMADRLKPPPAPDTIEWGVPE